MINKYRTKSCEIEAIEFTRQNYNDVVGFTDNKAKDLIIERCINGKAYCKIETLEGDMVATEGDFIIKGLRGEFYPCKPDVFNKKYEVIS